jgi:hypothetical protein
MMTARGAISYGMEMEMFVFSAVYWTLITNNP